ncbi:hypothetical protein JOF53_000005 [Crossiella equi]|uniref:Uncharacterized protein n=1 Tax=Crossiella equi TaxID=130796 RepID=A0ABS5A3M5_9PSEU|nr:hypothetical protein [Crossiella equi]MBP2471133.1 hypothetical protein [Crossiella equi]
MSLALIVAVPVSVSAQPDQTAAPAADDLGSFAGRQQAYLELLAAKARASRLQPMLADSSRTQQARRAQLDTALTSFQAESDLLQRAGLPGGRSSSRTPDRDWLPAPRTGPRFAASLMAMPSLAEVSGGRAIDPAAFIRGRAAAVDACRSSITEHAADTTKSFGKPGSGGLCMNGPVGMAYREQTPLDPNLFRDRLRQLPDNPPQALLDQHQQRVERPRQPPTHPVLPTELAESNSSCRSLDSLMDYVPLAGNALEHLCLLAFE